MSNIDLYNKLIKNIPPNLTYDAIESTLKQKLKIRQENKLLENYFPKFLKFLL